MHTNTVLQTKIFIRTKRLAAGNMGDVKHFDGISELRINHGPGYRVYFAKEGDEIFLLLCGGDKSTQARDIAGARSLLADRVRPTDRRKTRSNHVH